MFSVGLNVPRLNPTFLVASGPTEVSVAVTLPPVIVPNAWVEPLAGLSVPVNVSVNSIGVGVFEVVDSSPQPPTSAAIAQIRAPQAIRRSISSPYPSDRLLDFQWPASV